MKIFFLKSGQDMYLAAKFRTLKIYLISLFIFTILASCQPSFEFQPENPYDFDKLKIAGIEIKFDAFYAYGSPEGLRIRLMITNPTNYEIIIKNNINIAGQYFASHRLYHLTWDDLSTKEVDAPALKEAPFKIIGQDIEISLTCLLEKRTSKDFYDIIREEKFLVKFPTFIVDGKEYEFEPINFVYKKAKR
ncbi:hypothetical protein L0244_25670 [bacterium]|nr:hypothetical protein [bacterium]MCI0693264.1 hypothetical protein [candidate division KSB1 bacterium]